MHIYIYRERERERYEYVYTCVCIYIYICIYTHVYYSCYVFAHLEEADDARAGAVRGGVCLVSSISITSTSIIISSSFNDMFAMS